MATKVNHQEPAIEQEMEATVGRAGQWVIDHQNVLSGIVLAVIAVIVACIAVNNYVIRPKAAEANEENAKAQAYFIQGDYEKALAGDEADCIGFEAIADQYSHYQAGELAALYAGICHFEKGDYEQAAAYLAKYSAEDLLLDPAAHLLLGDAYVELGEMHKAARAYEHALDAKSEAISPIAAKKLGVLYLSEGEHAKAHKAFEVIKADYPTSVEAQDIDKYLAL